MIRLLLIEDHPIVREGLATVFEDQEDMEVVGQAGTARQGLSLAQALHPDVVVLDLELPDGSGLDLLSGLGVPALILTAYAQEQQFAQAMDRGARGYLLKGVPSAEIVRAVRAVAGGGSYIQPELVHLAVRGRMRLSQRESEVLAGIGRGLSNRLIADELKISERTVKFHVTSLLNKLNADNRAQAVARAAALGLNYNQS